MHAIHTFNPTTRFSDRAKAYVAYRPSYPIEAVRYLEDRMVLSKGKAIADIGAGTGLFSKILLDKGYAVVCVEPNKEMMDEGVRFLGAYKSCVWVNGRAEDTGLAAASQDIIVCAQAFHWFEPVAAKREIKRILTHDGYLILIWNSRKSSSNDFMHEYTALVRRYGKNYNKIHETQSDDNAISRFYGKIPDKILFENYQTLDCDALVGRAFSTSYMPAAPSPEYASAKKELERLFEKYQTHGTVTMSYETRVYYGQL